MPKYTRSVYLVGIAWWTTLGVGVTFIMTGMTATAIFGGYTSTVTAPGMREVLSLLVIGIVLAATGTAALLRRWRRRGYPPDGLTETLLGNMPDGAFETPPQVFPRATGAPERLQGHRSCSIRVG